MPAYILLANYTEQGIRNVKDSPTRLDAFRQLLKKFNGELKSFYLTMGRYDLVCIAELPDDEAAASVVLALASAGNVRTSTLKAFPEAEYRKIISALP